MDKLGVGEVFRLLIIAGGVVDGHGEEGVAQRTDEFEGYGVVRDA